MQLFLCVIAFVPQLGCAALSPLEDPLKPGAAGSPFAQGLLHWRAGGGDFRLLSVQFEARPASGSVEAAYEAIAKHACRVRARLLIATRKLEQGE